MRRVAAVALLAVAFLLVTAVPSYAWGGGGHGGGHGGHGGQGFGHHGFRGHGAVIIGPGCCWGPYGYWWDYPPYYYPPYYGYAPAPVIVQEAPVYIQQEPPQSYWYYCPSAKVYYPTAPTCPEAWIKVAPQ